MCDGALWGWCSQGRSRPKVQEVVAGDRDSVAVLRAIQALVEDIDKRGQRAVVRVCGPLRRTSGDTDSAMDVLPSIVGSFRLHIRDFKPDADHTGNQEYGRSMTIRRWCMLPPRYRGGGYGSWDLSIPPFLCGLD